MGCVSYAWFPFFAASSGVGLGVARYYYPMYVTGPPLFPLCNYVVAILYLVTILARYIYVDKAQSTCWNCPTLLIGVIAVMSYLARVQLISSKGLVQEYGVGDKLLLHIEEGLRCLMPFSTNLYCILQTVVSYKTRGSSRYTGPCMRVCRVLISVLITPVAHYIIFTHVTTHVLPMEQVQNFLVEYYHYVYWAFGGLTSLFILGFTNELCHIKSYCGCLIGNATAKVTPMGMLVSRDGVPGGFMSLDADGGEAEFGLEGFVIEEEEPCLSYVWLPVLTGFSAVGLHLARHFTDDLLTVTPMFPYLDHAVAALFLLTIIVRCAHVRKIQPTCFNGLAVIFGLLAIISQTSSLQLPITPIPQLGIYTVYVMLGAHCLLPFSTFLYCILQTVVSFRTKFSLKSGKLIRAQRVFVSVFITIAGLVIIATFALPYLIDHLIDYRYTKYVELVNTYLVLYYQYIHWAFEGLAVFFIIGFANEFRLIAMCCGCCSCKKRASRKIHPIDDDVRQGGP